MGILVLLDEKIYSDGYDLSGSSRQGLLDYSADVLEASVFGGGSTRQRAVGLKNVRAQVSGYWGAGATPPVGVDDAIIANLFLAGKVMSLWPVGNTPGQDVGYGFQAVSGNYQLFDAVGTVMPFSVEFQATNVLTRAMLMAKGPQSGSGSGPVVHLGQVSPTQKAYAFLHVFAPTGGGTLDVAINSASGAGFGGATTRLQFAQINAGNPAPQGQWLATALGPIGDGYWRADWSLGGSGGPWQFVVGLAIQ